MIPPEDIKKTLTELHQKMLDETIDPQVDQILVLQRIANSLEVIANWCEHNQELRK